MPPAPLQALTELLTVLTVAISVLVVLGGFVWIYRGRGGGSAAAESDAGRAEPPIDEVIDEVTETVREIGADGGASADALDRARYARADDDDARARRHAAAAVRLAGREAALLDDIDRLDQRLNWELPGDAVEAADDLDRARRAVHDGHVSRAESMLASIEDDVEESMLVHHGRGVQWFRDAEDALAEEEYERARMLFGRASEAFGRARSIALWQADSPNPDPQGDLEGLREDLAELREIGEGDDLEPVGGGGADADGGVPPIDSFEAAADRIETTLSRCERRQGRAAFRARIDRASRALERAHRAADDGEYERARRECDDARSECEAALDAADIHGFDKDRAEATMTEVETLAEEYRIRTAVADLGAGGDGADAVETIRSVVESSPEMGETVAEALADRLAAVDPKDRAVVVEAMAAVATAVPGEADPLAAAVVEYLHDDDPAVQRPALRVIGATGAYQVLSEAAVDALETVERHRDDNDPVVAEAAETATRRLEALRADRLRTMADTDPHALSGEEYASLLDREDPETREVALTGLAAATESRPATAADLVGYLADSLGTAEADGAAARALANLAAADPDAVPAETLVDVVETADETGVRADALEALASVAEHRAADVVEDAETIADTLGDDDRRVREAGTRTLAAVATDHPDVVAVPDRALPELVAAVTDHGDGRAARLLAVAADDDPGALTDYLPSLVETRDPADDGAGHVDDILASVAAHYRDRAARDPGAALKARDDLAAMLSLPSFPARGTVAAALTDLAAHDPEAVVDASLVERAAGYFSEGDGDTRAAVASLLATATARDPGPVEVVVADLLGSLPDCDPSVQRDVLRAVDRTGAADPGADRVAVLAAVEPHRTADDDAVARAADDVVRCLQLARAEDLKDRADRDPESVDPGEIATLAESEFAGVRNGAAEAAVAFTEALPEAGSALVNSLVPLLDDEECRDVAEAALGNVADTGEVPVPVLRRLVSGDLAVDRRESAALALAGMATERPAAFTDRTDVFVDIVESRAGEEVRLAAAKALAAITDAAPDAMGSAAETAGFWRSCLDDDADDLRAVAARSLATAVEAGAPVPDPGEAVALVDDPDQAVRESGARLLSALAGAEPLTLRSITTWLVTAHDHDDEGVREAVDAALRAVAGALRDAAAEDPGAVIGDIDRVCQLLEVEDDTVRVPVAGALVSLARTEPAALVDTDTDAVGRLSVLLEADDGDLRERGATALAAVADDHPGAVKPAAEALADGVTDASAVHRWAVLALSRAGRLDALDDSHLGALGPLRSLADDPDVNESVGDAAGEAVAHLARIRAARLRDADPPPTDEQMVAELGRLLEADAAGTRRDAAAAAAAVADADPDAVEPLTERLAALVTDDAAGEGAAAALASIVEAEPGRLSPDALWTLVDHGTGPRVREIALGALVGAPGDGDGSAIRPDRIPELLADDDPGVRDRALALAAEAAESRPAALAGAVPALAGLLDSDNQSIRERAAGTLRHVAGADPAAVRAEVPALVAALDDRSEAVASAAHETVLTVVEAAREAASGDPKDVASDMESLLSALSVDDSDIRRPAIDLLGRVAGADPEAVTPAVPRLVDLLEADAEDTRRAAAEAMADVAAADPTAVVDATDAMTDCFGEPATRKPALEAIAEIATVAPERPRSETASIAAMLYEDDPEVQRVACEALGNIGGETALGRLQEFRREADYEVRVAAESAIQRIEESAQSAETQMLPTDVGNTRTTGGVEEQLKTEFPDHEVVEWIGSGGNADVHKVRLADTGEVVALKVPRWDGTISSAAIDRFVDEAATWNKLDDHGNIVDILNWGTTPYPWMFLEYVPRALEDVVEELPLEQKLDILVAVSDALEYAHSRGVVHLDIKPTNILLGEDDVPKVADWGLARMLLEHTRTQMGMTPPYSAPEQLTEERGTIDRGTDVYQLGVLAYRVLTGRLPFEAERPLDLQQQILNTEPDPPSAVREDLPSGLDDIILTALAKGQDDRYEAALLFRDALREVPLPGE